MGRALRAYVRIGACNLSKVYAACNFPFPPSLPPSSPPLDVGEILVKAVASALNSSLLLLTYLMYRRLFVASQAILNVWIIPFSSYCLRFPHLATTTMLLADLGLGGPSTLSWEDRCAGTVWKSWASFLQRGEEKGKKKKKRKKKKEGPHRAIVLVCDH